LSNNDLTDVKSDLDNLDGIGTATLLCRLHNQPGTHRVGMTSINAFRYIYLELSHDGIISDCKLVPLGIFKSYPYVLFAGVEPSTHLGAWSQVKYVDDTHVDISDTEYKEVIVYGIK
jgi:hypothetical protein